MIPLGDIDLQKEIRLEDESNIVARQPAPGFARRVYSAKIEGRASDMTVAVYEGADAEEQWRQDIAKHSRLR